MTFSGSAGRRERLAATLVVAVALSLAPGIAGGQEADESGDDARLGALSTLQQLGQDFLSSSEDEAFLDPEVAFVLRASSRSSGANADIELEWQIAPGYYLYRKRMQFAAPEGETLVLGPPILPSGEVKHDDYFGDVEVYYGSVTARVPVDAPPGPVRLNVTYQGCADAGLCYPPITKLMTVALESDRDDASVPPGGSAAISAELPEQDLIARSLTSGSLLAVVTKFLVFGLLLTFTPCVLPMVPILSGIIAGQGDRISTGYAFSLSLVYVLTMAATYTLAGVAAGLSGASLQGVFQDPVVIVAFSLVFVALALSMFGFYALELPGSWQTRLAAWSGRRRGGTYLGVGLMGFLSALIVGPCIAPPLAGALIYIAQSGDATLGGIALFSMAMGMGVPLLLIGTSAGRYLPRAGAWMEVVKRIFGVALLGVAIYLLERVLPGWASLLAWASLLIVVAIYMGAIDALAPTASGWRRLWKGAGLVMMVYGVLLMVGAAGGGSDPFQPLKGLRENATAQRGLEFKRVKGPEGLRAELLAAAASGRRVMLDYYADWCVSCKVMERTTFADPGVRAALARTVLLQADVTKLDQLDKDLLAEFGLHGPPAILFFGPDGRERSQFRIVGLMKPERFRRVVERALGADPALLGQTI